MSRKAAWFVPVAVVVTCIPCLLIPLAATLIAAGAFGRLLGFLGVPWVLAGIASVSLGATLLYLRIRRRGVACPTQEPPTWFGKS